MAKLRAFREIQYPTLPLREEASSDDVQRLLRRVRPSHAPLHVTEVQLVDVTADAQAKTITWDHVATIPLGASR
ncbi:hypothetical protein ACF1A9_20260 [Streptomyces sp. NPDC014872]|uniref:hypothetical protein n=1 Tax=Streptomyces sp. NPDC014872 TaxID=3364926 RepID=UPI0036F9B9CF